MSQVEDSLSSSDPMDTDNDTNVEKSPRSSGPFLSTRVKVGNERINSLKIYKLKEDKQFEIMDLLTKIVAIVDDNKKLLPPAVLDEVAPSIDAIVSILDDDENAVSEPAGSAIETRSPSPETIHTEKCRKRNWSDPDGSEDHRIADGESGTEQNNEVVVKKKKAKKERNLIEEEERVKKELEDSRNLETAATDMTLKDVKDFQDINTNDQIALSHALIKAGRISASISNKSLIIAFYMGKFIHLLSNKHGLSIKTIFKQKTTGLKFRESSLSLFRKLYRLADKYPRLLECVGLSLHYFNANFKLIKSVVGKNKCFWQVNDLGHK